MAQKEFKIVWLLNGLTVQSIEGDSDVGKMLECAGKDHTDDSKQQYDMIECYGKTMIGWQRRWTVIVHS